MEKENEPSTISVSKELRRKLQIMKNELCCSSIEDLLERILKITRASQLKKS